MSVRHSIGLLLAILGLALLFHAGGASGYQQATSWAGLGDSYSSGEGIPGAHGRCQRADGERTSATAWPAGAYEDLRGEVDFNDMVLVACTGAIADDASGQLSEAAAALGDDRFDLVTFSFGGNNIGFADVLVGCLGLEDLPWGVINPHCKLSEDELRERVDMLVGNRPIGASYTGTTDLPELYREVADHVSPGGDVVVVGYPNIIEDYGRWPSWQRHIPLPRCEGISAGDTQMIRSVTGYLNQQIALAVQRADAKYKATGVRFHFVDISRNPYEESSDPSDRHGLCAQDEWLNGITLGNGRKEQSFHPNQKGHTATAQVVADVIRNNVSFDDGPTGWEIDETGIGPIKLGMTVDDVNAIGLSPRVTAGPYCDSWAFPGLKGVLMSVPHSSNELEAVSLSKANGHGPRGIEIGAPSSEIAAEFGDEAVLADRLPELHYAIYQVADATGKNALQLTVNTQDDTVQFIENGRIGHFYFPDGTELCA